MMSLRVRDPHRIYIRHVYRKYPRYEANITRTVPVSLSPAL
jgi:hypothetical protein